MPFNRFDCRIVTSHRILRALFWFAILAVIGNILYVERAHANPAQCHVLQRELASLEGFATGSLSPGDREYERFNTLAKRQSAALKRAHRDASSLGCLNRSGRQNRHSIAACPALLDKIGKMEKNLQYLDRKRNKAVSSAPSSRSDIRRKRRNIQAEMQQLNCDTTSYAAADRAQSEERERPVRRLGLLARLFGTGGRRSRYSNDTQERIIRLQRDALADERPTSYGNVYRTLCVRVCDGYYFPVSFATTRNSFDADRAFCEASNPDTEMRLFFHENPHQDSEDMQDLTGQLYVDLPNAFRYRREIVSQDICPRAPQKGAFQQIAGTTLSEVLEENQAQFGNVYGDFEDQPAAPSAKPDPFSDIDTHMATVGEFSLQTPDASTDITAQKPLSAEASERVYNPATIAESGIRVVGPTFLDDQQSVKLLQAPDQIQVQ